MSGRILHFCRNWVLHKKWFPTNKSIIIIIIIIIIITIIMINQTVDIAKYLQTVQHDSKLSEDFNASP